MHNQVEVHLSLLIDSAAAVQGMRLVVVAAGSGDMSLEAEEDNSAAVVNILHHHVNNIISCDI